MQHLFSASVTTSDWFESSQRMFEISDVTKYFAKCSFFHHKFIHTIFILSKILKRFFILPVLLLNRNKTCCIDLFFCQFSQVIEHQARRVQSFSQSFKISFLIMIGREQNYTNASRLEDHK